MQTQQGKTILAVAAIAGMPTLKAKGQWQAKQRKDTAVGCAPGPRPYGRPQGGDLVTRQCGEAMSDKRRRWVAEGRCRDCGAPLDRPGASNKCARCRASRKASPHAQRRRGPRDTAQGVGLDVVVTLPAPVIEQIEARAKERGETVDGWCRAEILAIVEGLEP